MYREPAIVRLVFPEIPLVFGFSAKIINSNTRIMIDSILGISFMFRWLGDSNSLISIYASQEKKI